MIISFIYDASLNAFEFSNYDTNVITVNNFRPRYRVTGTADPDMGADIGHTVVPYITSSGAIGIVNSFSKNTDAAGKWYCTVVYFTD